MSVGDSWGYRWLESLLKWSHKYDFVNTRRSDRLDFEEAFYLVHTIDAMYASSVYDSTMWNDGPRNNWVDGDFIKLLGHVIKEQFVVVLAAVRLSGSAKTWFDAAGHYGRFLFVIGHDGVIKNHVMYVGKIDNVDEQTATISRNSVGLQEDLTFYIEEKQTFLDETVPPILTTQYYYINASGSILKKDD